MVEPYVPPPRLQEQEQEAQFEWATRFNEFIVTNGPDLCVAGYEGYLRTGSKGAVAVSREAKSSRPMWSR